LPPETGILSEWTELLSGVHKKRPGNKSGKCRYDGLCPIAILLTPPPARSTGAISERTPASYSDRTFRSAPSPRRILGAGAASGGRMRAGGSHRRPISRRLSGAIIIRPNLCTTIRPALEQSVSLSLACLEDSHISEAIA